VFTRRRVKGEAVIFRLAVRSLLKTPVLLVAAVLSLTLGIGANAAIFSLMNSLVLRPLPLHSSDRLTLVTIGADQRSFLPYSMSTSLREGPSLFDGVAAWATQRLNVAQRGPSEFVDVLYVSGEFFGVLEVAARTGRVLAPQDDAPGAAGQVAVLSDAYWRRQFGADASIVGRTMTLRDRPFTVVGVAESSFFGLTVGQGFDIALPFAAEPLIMGPQSLVTNAGAWWVNVLLRLAPNQTLRDGTTALRGIQTRISETSAVPPMPAEMRNRLKEGFALLPLQKGLSPLRETYRVALFALMSIVAAVLLVACANVANLLLARSASRRYEMSVLRSLGASSWHIVALACTESLLIAVPGTALALLCGRVTSAFVVSQLGTVTQIPYLDLSLDPTVLFFTAAVGVACTVLCALVPALLARRVDPAGVLKAGARSSQAVGWTNTALLVSQVALSFALVILSVAFVSSLLKLSDNPLSAGAAQVLTVRVEPNLARGIA
jgi:predicted permease